MGGIGSGASYRRKSPLAIDDLPALSMKDVRHLLSPTEPFQLLTVSGLGYVTQEIPIESQHRSVKGRAKGVQFYFLCPGCLSRRQVLRNIAGVYRCKGCLRAMGLRYQSESESKLNKAIRAERKLREKLGGEWAIEKPKGMWESTFDRLLERHEEIDRRIWRGAPKAISQLLKGRF